MAFATRALGPAYDVLAPDGSEVRLLASAAKGSMAHFTLQPGQTSLAVCHRTVEELWFVLSGAGEMWRSRAGKEQVTSLLKGISLAIPVGTSFQFRCTGKEPLQAVAVTMPPWPGEDEAFSVAGKW